MQYIGNKKVKQIIETGDKTETGVSIVKIHFQDGSVEYFSKLMLDKILSNKGCDATELRDKRIRPVVEVLAAVLRDWGIKTGELPYISALLNQSLNHNSDQALIKLISKWMPKPNSLDDLDYITVNRILRSKDEESE